MRIAQIAPLYEPIPPPGYGGTERIVSVLTEELVRRGHDVTLFASADSVTKSELVAGSKTGLRRMLSEEAPHRRSDIGMAHHLAMFGEVLRRRQDFDIVHSHADILSFPLLGSFPGRFLATTHGRLDLPETRRVHRAYPDLPLVAISQAQRVPLPWANWISTVYNAIPLEGYRLQEQPGKYLAFLGRFSPEKGADLAIDVALRTGLPLKLAAKVDPTDREYFEAVIRPRLDHPLIEYIGEIGDAEKSVFLGGALAYLFPIDWPEPFGITMIEAMACGTPVIARRRGAIPEVIRDGVTGLIVETADEMIAAIGRIGSIDRRACRRWVEQRFTPAAIADGYEAAYRRLLAARAGSIGAFPWSASRWLDEPGSEPVAQSS